MKILQIGCGGIGSFLTEELFQCYLAEQLPNVTEITIADSDIVEHEQLNYQNFNLKEVGKNKANALAKRFVINDIRVFSALSERVSHEALLCGYDLIVLCVDNDYTRKMVVKFCHEHDVEFLDLRATGRRIFAMPKADKIDENMKFIDSNDIDEYSCQEIDDKRKGLVQKGNKIVAMVGTQMILNYLRGHNNRVISVVI